MTAQELLSDLNSTEEFFERSTRVLTEEDSEFRPADGMYTAAQQVAHTAQTIEWFVEGAGRPAGFDMDFASHYIKISDTKSLGEAKAWLSRAFASCRTFIESADLAKPLPPGPVMGGMPVGSIVGAITDHSAHHRGALTVYSRLLGKTPLMPYME